MNSLEFWFEFPRTCSYPAAMRIEDAARRAGVQRAWRPFLLGPIFKAQGWNDFPFDIYPAKGRYMWRDMERVCAARGLPLRRPSQCPRNGLLAARLAGCFRTEPWWPELVRQIYLANFAHDRGISDRSVLEAALASAGQPGSLLEMADSAEARARLRAETEHAQALGVLGAPTFVIGTELFWGNNRLEEAVAWARGEPERFRNRT